jgi:hypothetical protein
MNRAGKAHWLTVAGIASVLVVAGLFMFGKDDAGETASAFMTALAKGDVDKLTQLSYYEGTSKEVLRKRWEFTVKRAAPHFMFIWRISAVTHMDEDDAVATLQVIRNAETGQGFEEKFQLPLLKANDEWKVDIRAISRNMYPGLPR